MRRSPEGIFCRELKKWRNIKKLFEAGSALFFAPPVDGLLNNKAPQQAPAIKRNKNLSKVWCVQVREDNRFGLTFPSRFTKLAGGRRWRTKVVVGKKNIKNLLLSFVCKKNIEG